MGFKIQYKAETGWLSVLNDTPEHTVRSRLTQVNIMGFKIQYKSESGRLSNTRSIPERMARSRLGKGITDKMKLGYDVGKKNETLYARYTYVKDDPLSSNGLI